MEAQQLTEMLRWANINQSLRNLTFEDLTEVLLHAIKQKERPEILLRVYGRWNKLRSRRDKDEILAGGIPHELTHYNCGYGG